MGKRSGIACKHAEGPEGASALDSLTLHPSCFRKLLYGAKFDCISQCDGCADLRLAGRHDSPILRITAKGFVLNR